MRSLMLKKASFWFSGVAMACALAACGGGGDDDHTTTISGTAARGAPLATAAVELACAEGSGSGMTAADGNFSVPVSNLAYPCVGTATQAPISYRGILFDGSRLNITPVTELLVSMIAANVEAATNNGDLVAAFRADATLAASIIDKAPEYREATLELLEAELIAAGLSEAQAAAIVEALGEDFDRRVFAANGTDEYDAALERLADSGLIDDDGTIADALIEAAEQVGESLPPPDTQGTGGVGR